MFNRADAIDKAFLARVQDGGVSAPKTLFEGTDYELADIFDTQLLSRHLDLMARKTAGKTFYTLGSSGHEGLAALAMASRLTDMAFLHYRDAAFCIQRRKQIEGSTPAWDMALSFCASSEDPVSGGRHKVLGGLDILTPPQTSTIASHLPKAVGAAHALGLGHADLPPDSVILCSFGDASSNHSTAQGAMNTAAWTAYQGSPMPIVFVCEDNEIGISVRTPKGWIAANFSNRPGLHYMHCDGTDIGAALDGCKAAVNYARTRRKPVFLHFRTVRLMGHAGADIEAKYTPLDQIEAKEAEDPLLKTASHLMTRQIMTSSDVINAYETMRARVMRVAEAAFKRPKLTTTDEIMAPIIPPKLDLPAVSIDRALLEAAGCAADGRKLPLNKMLNMTLAETMTLYDNALIFGEDVGRKGGVYGVTLDLLKRFGARRVQDTLLDEQAILGLAIGAGQVGYLSIPEIQFLAYVHNAEDQIRGEASTLSFFSNGQFANPMVVRIAGLAYQRGFGGHFHNDNSLAALRDIPGVIVVCPSEPDDARRLLREAVRLAREEQRVVIFVEPIALYNTADIEDGDKAWAGTYVFPDEDTAAPFGEVGQWGKGKSLAIVTYGNGYHLSRRAAASLPANKLRIIDLRWLSPLPMDSLLKAVGPCENILIVDECRRTGSPSEELTTRLVEGGYSGQINRITADDSFIPLGAAAYSVLPSTDDIVAAAQAQLSKGGAS